MTKADLKASIRVVQDFPKPGVNFLDIGSLLAQPAIYNFAIDTMAAALHDVEFDRLAAIDARGFLFGASLMQQLNKPLVLIRKAGKLPGDVVTESYALEYGEASIEIQKDSINANEKIVLIDDILATGGTVSAACKLIKKVQADVVLINALIGLDYLSYRDKLQDYRINTVLKYDARSYSGFPPARE